MRVFCITGKPGSGKGAVAEYIASTYTAKEYRFSKILYDILDRLGKPNDRKSLNLLAMALRKLYGDAILAEVVKKDIEQEKPTIALIDGLRFLKEHEILKKLPGYTLIAVTASPQTRFSRMTQRGEKDGETKMTKKMFEAQEKLPTERHIDELIARSDITLSNDNSLETLHEQINNLFP